MTVSAPPPARPRRNALAVAVAVALALTTVLAACGGSDGDSDSTGASEAPTDDALTGVQRDPLPRVGDLSLPDAAADGEPLAFRAGEGSLLLVYFGYTSCPDVCPTTMADTRAALDDLPEDEADRVDVAMITIDPARDTREVLTGYARSFVSDSHALRTDDDTALRAAADAFGADYRVTTDAGGEVEVGHTGHLYVVDDEGRLVLQWPFGTPAGDMAHDLALLLDDAAAS